MVETSVSKQLDRFDMHEEKRSKTEVMELRSIATKLDQIESVLMSISMSLSTMATLMTIEEKSEDRDG